MVRRIRDDFLTLYLSDNVKARQMLPNGTYTRKKIGNRAPVNAQERLLEPWRTASNKRKPAR